MGFAGTKPNHNLLYRKVLKDRSQSSNKHLCPQLMAKKERTPIPIHLVRSYLCNSLIDRVSKEHYGGLLIFLNTTFDEEGKQSNDKYRYSAKAIIEDLEELGLPVLIPEVDSVFRNEELPYPLNTKDNFLLIQIVWDESRTSARGSRQEIGSLILTLDEETINREPSYTLD